MRNPLALAPLLAVAVAAFCASFGSSAQDADARAKTLFDQGVQQQQSDQNEAAVASYRQVLELKPQSGSTLNNLGQASAALGRTDEALDYYRRAIDAGGDNQAFYRKQYADLLRASKREPEAAAEYRKLALTLPGTAAVTASYAEGDPNELIKYLWDLVTAGEVLTAAETALTSLAATPDRSTDVELLAIVARALGQETLAPAQADSLRARVAALTTDPIVGTGARGIVALYDAPRGDFSWWASRGSLFEDPARGIWPRDAFRYLMRSLGARAESRNDFATAEAYYLSAAELDRQELDPLAFQALCKMYLRSGEIEKIQAIVSNSRYIESIFEGKSEAYRRGQLEKIYSYHVTLSYIYGALARQGKMAWGDRNTRGSAVYQLENAQRVGKLIDSNRPNLPAPPAPTTAPTTRAAHVDVGVVELLAEYYATRNPVDAENLRVESARRLQAAGNAAAAAQVLRPVPDQVLQQRDGTLYQNRQRQLNAK